MLLVVESSGVLERELWGLACSLIALAENLVNQLALFGLSGLGLSWCGQIPLVHFSTHMGIPPVVDVGNLCR